MNKLSAQSIARELHLENSKRLGQVLFHGQSMLPLLQDGDSLVVEPLAWESIRVGDVLVVRFEDKYPALRVAEKLASKLYLMADNWPGVFYDAWPEDVLGKVVATQGRPLGERAWRWASLQAVTRYRLGRLASKIRGRSKKWLGRLTRDLRALRGGLLGMPTNLQVNVSSVCNLACRMCPYLEVHKNDDHLDFMSRETFEQLMPSIRRIGSVQLSGSGEPLANKDFLWFIERLRAERPRIHIDMTTNGTLLRGSIASELIRLEVDKIHVSIDGASAGTVESIRLGSDFEKLISNLERLAHMKRELGSPRPVVMANYMVGFGTYRELPEFVRLARRVGISEMQLLEMQPASAEDLDGALRAGIASDGGRALKDAIALGQRLGVALHLPLAKSPGCFHPYHPHVSENGEVYPCCYLDYDGRSFFAEGQRLEFPSVSFGNVAKLGFRKVWNSKAYGEMRRKTARGDFDWFCKACHGHRLATAATLAPIGAPAPRAG